VSETRTVRVELGMRGYDIRIGTGLIAEAGAHLAPLAKGRPIVVVTDATVARLPLSALEHSLGQAGIKHKTVTLPRGEGTKDFAHFARLCEEILALGIERQTLLVALGGGVVGDITGFAAACLLRGLAYVQIPTTLLAQVDSSVGGKVGVNLRAGKNLVGAFHQPKLVLCDLDTLATLPLREFRAGLAEVIKYGIIYDAALFARLERDLPKLLQREAKTLEGIVARCCEIKAEVVGYDEREGGLRAILNFGHTIGHALEAISSYGKYLHGEAISIGQVAAAELSAKVFKLPAADVARIRALFEAAGLPTRVDLTPAQRRKLFSAMRLDKKVSGGEIKFVLAERIGKVRFGQRVPEALIQEVI